MSGKSYRKTTSSDASGEQSSMSSKGGGGGSDFSLMGNAAMQEQLAAETAVEGKGTGLVDAVTALRDAITAGDADAVCSALEDVNQAFDVAEHMRDTEAIKDAGRIAYNARKEERPVDIDAEYTALLERFGAHRAKRKDKEAMDEAMTKVRNTQDERIADLPPIYATQGKRILDTRRQHEKDFLKDNGGEWTAELASLYSSKFPPSDAEMAAIALAQDWEISVSNTDTHEDRLNRMMRFSGIRDSGYKPPTEEDRQKARAKNAEMERKAGVGGFGKGGRMSQSVNMSSIESR